LKLTGALDHDKKRYSNRTSEPVPTGDLGPAPKHFDAALKLIWKEVVKQIPPDVLTNADRLVVELTCRLTQKLRSGELTASLSAQLVSCMSRLAMTPADRPKVQVAPTGSNSALPPSPFAKFAP
jgi:phage terminase small subunit